MFTYYEYEGLQWSVSDKLPIKHLFSGKLGGVGDWPYSTNPDPDWETIESQKRVRKLWQKLFQGAGFPEKVCLTRQVHGNVVRLVTEDDAAFPPLRILPKDCDGLAVQEKNLPIGVFSADCVPVLLCNQAGTVAAALHCGWKGTAKDMVGAGVEALQKLGVESKDIIAAIGPGISSCCFEVGPEVPEAMIALLRADAEGCYWPEEGVPGKFMVDLKEVNRHRLLQLGVKEENIDVSADCTKCDTERYWSHRATKGVRGTMVSLLML